MYALDATTVDLCLSTFPWAPFRSTKAAVKLHTLLDLRGSIRTFIHISDGKMHDVNVLDLLLIEAGAFYIMDRGYLDFERLYAMDQAGGFFITRAKRNLDARRVYSAPVDRDAELICDQTITLNGFYAAKHYPAHLRRIRYRDPETGKNLVFLTNQFALPAYFSWMQNDFAANSIILQFQEIFRRSGYVNLQTVTETPRGPDEQGFMIALHDPNNPSLPTQKIMEAFSIANIPYKKNSYPRGHVTEHTILYFCRAATNPLELKCLQWSGVTLFLLTPADLRLDFRQSKRKARLS